MKNITPNTQGLIHAAVGIIFNNKNEVLVALRPPHTTLGNLWEFPGGKVELNETVEQALHRELQEEVGIVVVNAKPLTQITHEYPDRTVYLDVWRVLEFTGEPRGLEGQPIKWVLPADLLKLDLLPTSYEIVPLLIK